MSDLKASNPLSPEGQPRVIAGFWRRIGAYLFDLLLLSLPLFVFGFLFYDQAAALGAKGKLVGGALMLVYFTFFGSRSGQGRTIGQRWLGLRVVGKDGESVGFGRAAMRALILTLPVCAGAFGDAGKHAFEANPPLSSLLLMSAQCLTGFGIFVSLAYLYLFNRKTRQSLHDLTTETFVISSADPAQVAVRTPLLHKVVAAVLLAVSALGPLGLPLMRGRLGAGMDAMLGTAAALQALPEVDGNDMQVMNQTDMMNRQRTQRLVVAVRLRQKPQNPDAEAARIAGVVLQHALPGATKPITIVLSSGFDLGLAHWTNSHSQTRTAAEWRLRALQTLPHAP